MHVDDGARSIGRRKRLGQEDALVGWGVESLFGRRGDDESGQLPGVVGWLHPWVGGSWSASAMFAGAIAAKEGRGLCVEGQKGQSRSVRTKPGASGKKGKEKGLP